VNAAFPDHQDDSENNKTDVNLKNKVEVNEENKSDLISTTTSENTPHIWGLFRIFT